MVHWDKNEMLKYKMSKEKESIPVGCLPTAEVTPTPGG